MSAEDERGADGARAAGSGGQAGEDVGLGGGGAGDGEDVRLESEVAQGGGEELRQGTLCARGVRSRALDQLRR